MVLNILYFSTGKNIHVATNECVIFNKHHYYVMTGIAKVIEIIGTSEKGWTEAVQAALDEAKKTVNRITGLEVLDKTAKVDPTSGQITEYRVGVKIAFGVEH
jgi:dodecin